MYLLGLFVKERGLLFPSDQGWGQSADCREFGCLVSGDFVCVLIRDVIFRKMTNRNQTDTNEMATIETKYQTDLYSAENTKI